MTDITMIDVADAPRKIGRPTAQIDLGSLANAAADGFTQKEAASLLRVSVSTLKRHLQTDIKMAETWQQRCPRPRKKVLRPRVQGGPLSTLSPRDLHARALAGRTKQSVGAELQISRDAFSRALAQDKERALAWAQGVAERVIAIAIAEAA